MWRWRQEESGGLGEWRREPRVVERSHGLVERRACLPFFWEWVSQTRGCKMTTHPFHDWSIDRSFGLVRNVLGFGKNGFEIESNFISIPKRFRFLGLV